MVIFSSEEGVGIHRKELDREEGNAPMGRDVVRPTCTSK